uniref:RNA helicase n=1 Tax=Rhabditophanes sp. KR3021 TaxID=114890 RepID=A0AC35TIK6_9BILA
MSFNNRGGGRGSSGGGRGGFTPFAAPVVNPAPIQVANTYRAESAPTFSAKQENAPSQGDYNGNNSYQAAEVTPVQNLQGQQFISAPTRQSFEAYQGPFSSNSDQQQVPVQQFAAPQEQQNFAAQAPAQQQPFVAQAPIQQQFGASTGFGQVQQPQVFAQQPQAFAQQPQAFAQQPQQAATPQVFAQQIATPQVFSQQAHLEVQAPTYTAAPESTPYFVGGSNATPVGRGGGRGAMPFNSGRGGFSGRGNSSGNEEAPAPAGRGGFSGRGNTSFPPAFNGEEGGRGGFSGRGRGNVVFSHSGDSNRGSSRGGGYRGNCDGDERGGRGGYRGRGGEDGERQGNYRGGGNEESAEGEEGGGRGGYNNRGGRGGGRGGGFSEGARDIGSQMEEEDAATRERQPIPYFVPSDRPVDELFLDDKKDADYFGTVDDLDDDILVTHGTDNFIKYDSWAECELHPQLLANIKASGYIKPRKIQAYAMPFVVQKIDLKAQGETGSGKSAAFLVPIIDDIKRNFEGPSEPCCPIALIIAPTRELVLQTHEQARKFSNGMGVTVAKCYGQYSVRENINELERGCNILCATPGRLKHFVEREHVNLKNLQYLVLDEADSLFESSFLSTIQETLLIGNCPPVDKRTTLLFSATFPDQIEDFAAELLKPDHAVIKNASFNTANKRVKHTFYKVPYPEKQNRVCELLLAEVEESFALGKPLRRTLIFVEMKRIADALALFLIEKKVRAVSINGDRPQSAREQALNDFRTHKVDVLVATDVCARGLDIKDLDHVINVDLSKSFVTFIHRCGRAGRLHEGFATSFYNPRKDAEIKDQIIGMLQHTGQPIPAIFNDEEEEEED